MSHGMMCLNFWLFVRQYPSRIRFIGLILQNRINVHAVQKPELCKPHHQNQQPMLPLTNQPVRTVSSISSDFNLFSYPLVNCVARESNKQQSGNVKAFEHWRGHWGISSDIQTLNLFVIWNYIFNETIFKLYIY